MKVRFSTLDIIAILPELRAKICTGWRVNQVFDCDYKTYIFKLNKSIVQMKRDNDPLSVNEETENKMTFIIESGLRIHSTNYDWPRMPAPGQFATKLRKHLRNKRVEDIRQVGIDRVIDIRFGSSHLANHLIIELYDRGNLVLTDADYIIIAVLRWRKPSQAEKLVSKKGKGKQSAEDDDIDKLPTNEQVEDTDGFKVGQTYPIDKCRKIEDLSELSEEKICDLLRSPKVAPNLPFHNKKQQKQKQTSDDKYREINLKELFNPHVIYGSSLLDDKLLTHLTDADGKKYIKSVIRIDLDESDKMNESQIRRYASVIRRAFDEADRVITQVQQLEKSPGYIVQKKQIEATNVVEQTTKGSNNNYKNKDNDKKSSISLTTNVDFFPILSCAERKVQQENLEFIIQEFESFDQCVDVYYTNLEAQKIDTKTFNAEKEARKKLVNLKIAQERRLDELNISQKEDEFKGRLIELNFDKVENALLIIRSMLANQLSWNDISAMIEEAKSMNDPIASLITGTNFQRNEISMRLENPYDDNEDPKEGMTDANKSTNVNNKKGKQMKDKNKNRYDENAKYRIVDIDIGLSAHANARKFFDRRRNAVDKERKTIEVSKKAYKNVERRTKEMLKEVVVQSNITKARKRYWFENFSWFISSEGYLVVAGRDAEQNDLLVKRYMKNNDIYVHADLHGASSVIIKNESSLPIPPKTLNESGTFAVCNSSAWDNKIVQASWWVYPNQVTKTAPTGEYLTSGAFIIRGKKNYLPIANLVLGFGFLFRLDEESIERRRCARLAKEAQNLKCIEDEKRADLDVEDASNHTIESASIKGNLLASNTIDAEDRVDDTHVESFDTKSNDQKNVTQTKHDTAEPPSDEDEDEEDEKQTEHRLIDTLTEFPQPDDILLYAIPMCGPYNAFQNFKFKVKVIPGANKRGKATKTSLGMFLHDKRATQREKDLLRALKDQDYARNVPNKVKISAPNLNRDRNKIK